MIVSTYKVDVILLILAIEEGEDECEFWCIACFGIIQGPYV